MTPLYPNDLVWTMTAGSNHINAEVPFDDYLSQGALVLAPMNDRLKMVPHGVREVPGSAPVLGVCKTRRENGMEHTGSPAESSAIRHQGYDARSPVGALHRRRYLPAK